jgi:hypothetical protein
MAEEGWEGGPRAVAAVEANDGRVEVVGRMPGTDAMVDASRQV